MNKIGLIINPIAGMGGSVGLKGTDHVAAEALRRGAVPMAGERASLALRELLPLREELLVFTGPGMLGEKVARALGFATRVLPAASSGSRPAEPPDAASSSCAAFMATSAADTVALARTMQAEDVRLLLFAGGDGTARNIYEAVGLSLTVIGIPAGVKIHSPVYAKSPLAAGSLAKLFLSGSPERPVREEEVLDIDEELYRQEIIRTRLYGYLRIPAQKSFTQDRKAPTPVSDEEAIDSIASEILSQMEPEVCYIVGAGTTPRRIMQRLGLTNTLIGVDLICNRQVVANDLSGSELFSRIRGRKAKLIITITGGQGYLLGRGNQQLTPEVLRAVGRENILIIATRAKLASLGGRPLMIDINDAALSRELCGYYRVITGRKETVMCRVTDGTESV